MPPAQTATTAAPPSQDVLNTVEKTLAVVKKYKLEMGEVFSVLRTHGNPRGFLFRLLNMLDVSERGGQLGATHEKLLMDEMAQGFSELRNTVVTANATGATWSPSPSGKFPLTALLSAARDLGNIEGEWKRHITSAPAGTLDAALAVIRHNQMSSKAPAAVAAPAAPSKPTLAGAVQKYLETHEGALNAIHQQLWGKRAQNGVRMEYVAFPDREKDFAAIEAFHKKLEDIGNGAHLKTQPPLGKQDIELLRCALMDTTDRNFPNHQPGLATPVDKALQDMKRLVKEIENGDYLLPAVAKPASGAMLGP